MTEFQIGIQAAYDLKPNPRQVWPKNHLNHAACKLLLFCCSPFLSSSPSLLPEPSAILSAICCVVFCGFIGCAFAHSICKMIGIYAYRLDAVTIPPPRGYPFHPLLRTISRFSPAVTALPADFRPLSLAAGHCGYCSLSLPPHSMSRPLHMHIHMHRSDNPPPTSPSLLTCYQIPVLRLLLFRVPGHLLCAVCAGMCLLSALCSLFFSTLSTTHPPIPYSSLFFCPAALYPFRHPLSPSASASQMLHF